MSIERSDYPHYAYADSKLHDMTMITIVFFVTKLVLIPIHGTLHTSCLEYDLPNCLQ